MTRTMILKTTFLTAALFSAPAFASVAPAETTSTPAFERSQDGDMQLSRRGRGADDGAGHDRRGRGKDDGPNHTSIKGDDSQQVARRGRGADDGAGHVRGGHGADDAPNHG